MGLRNLFQKIDREHWFVCYTCMGNTSYDEVSSIFHSLAPKVTVIGRGWQQCPRCGGTNTKSFAELKAERQDSALWGFERIVKKHSQRFELDR